METFRLRRVKWANHPVLENLELDFTDNCGVPFDNIVFAGENGSGKTTILSSLADVIRGCPLDYFEFLEYVVDGIIYRASPIENAGLFEYGWYKLLDVSSGESFDMNFGRGRKGQGDIGDKQLLDDIRNLRRYGCSLSKARSDFQTKRISSTTTSSTDLSLNNVDQSNDFTPLKQLLIDIDSQDNTEYRKINRSRSVSPMSEEEFYRDHSKMYRFSNAFNQFFDKMQFSGVEDRDGEKALLFVKNGISINVDDLSTGEKQIVFRGAYLLSNRLKTSIAMVDEPEVSMHPLWQEKILSYYQTMFVDSSGGQNTQILFATHSEQIVKEALRNSRKNLVIVLSSESGSITATKVIAPSKLPVITSAETNYLAFGVCSIDYHIELFGFLQQRNGLKTIAAVDRFIYAHPSYNPTIHAKPYTFIDANRHRRTFQSLPVYVRNCIDHPDSTHLYSRDEMVMSTELLRSLL